MDHNLPPQVPQGPEQQPPLTYDDEALQQMFLAPEGQQDQPIQNPEDTPAGTAEVEAALDDLAARQAQLTQRLAPPPYHAKFSGRSDLGPNTNDLPPRPHQLPPQ